MVGRRCLITLLRMSAPENIATDRTVSSNLRATLREPAVCLSFQASGRTSYRSAWPIDYNLALWLIQNHPNLCRSAWPQPWWVYPSQRFGRLFGNIITSGVKLVGSTKRSGDPPGWIQYFVAIYFNSTTFNLPLSTSQMYTNVMCIYALAYM